MERTNIEYLQLIFDKYDIKPDTEVGFDYELDKKITAYDLLMDFADLEHREQNVSMCDVMVADHLGINKQDMLNKLFDAYQLIKKINRFKGDENAK